MLWSLSVHTSLGYGFSLCSLHVSVYLSHKPQVNSNRQSVHSIVQPHLLNSPIYVHVHSSHMTLTEMCELHGRMHPNFVGCCGPTHPSHHMTSSTTSALTHGLAKQQPTNVHVPTCTVHYAPTYMHSFNATFGTTLQVKQIGSNVVRT